MTPRKLIVLILVIGIAITAYVTKGFGLWDDGELDGQLTLYGNVDVREVEMGFRVGGRISSIPVDEGDHVEAGTLLAIIDAKPIQNRATVADAQIANAQANLARLENGSRSQTIAAARARLDGAEAQLAQTSADVTRRRPLSEEGAISRNQWEDTQAAFRVARAQRDEARAALSLTQTGARQEDIAAARAQLASAKATRDVTSTDLSDTRLVAAGAGTVITRAAEPGALMQPGQTVLTISIDDPLRVRAYVAEPDLSLIDEGMEVTITADGNPKTYKGQIGFISPRAEFTPKSVETQSLRADLVYQVRITIMDPDGGLRQGQPVTVNITNSRTEEEG